jgi:hypothetical protein
MIASVHLFRIRIRRRNRIRMRVGAFDAQHLQGALSRHIKNLEFVLMAEPGAPFGNKNAVKNRPWAEAINRALLAEDGKKLRALADKLIDRALEGDVQALKEVGDRADGKAIQAIANEGDTPFVVQVIRYSADDKAP